MCDTEETTHPTAVLVAHLLNVLPVRNLTLPCATRNTPLGWKLIGTAACVPAFLRIVRTAPRAHTAQKHEKPNRQKSGGIGQKRRITGN